MGDAEAVRDGPESCSKTVNKKKQLVRCTQGRIPVNLMAIAQRLSLRVYTLPNLPAPSRAMVRPDPDAQMCIYLKEQDSALAQRHALATAIAHCVLNHDYIGEGVLIDRFHTTGLTAKQNFEASNYSAQILIPDHQLDQIIALSNNSVTAEELAERFEVSDKFMGVKLASRAMYHLNP